MGVCVFFVKIENEWDEEKKPSKNLVFPFPLSLWIYTPARKGRNRDKAHFDVCVVNKH